LNRKLAKREYNRFDRWKRKRKKRGERKRKRKGCKTLREVKPRRTGLLSLFMKP
jgi:hypothetical protein